MNSESDKSTVETTKRLIIVPAKRKKVYDCETSEQKCEAVFKRPFIYYIAVVMLPFISMGFPALAAGPFGGAIGAGLSGGLSVIILIMIPCHFKLYAVSRGKSRAETPPICVIRRRMRWVWFVIDVFDGYEQLIATFKLSGRKGKILSPTNKRLGMFKQETFGNITLLNYSGKDIGSITLKEKIKSKKILRRGKKKRGILVEYPESASPLHRILLLAYGITLSKPI